MIIDTDFMISDTDFSAGCILGTYDLRQIQRDLK